MADTDHSNHTHFDTFGDDIDDDNSGNESDIAGSLDLNQLHGPGPQRGKR